MFGLFLQVLIFWVGILTHRTQECFGEPPDRCLDCAYDSYKPEIGIDEFIPSSLCKKKHEEVLDKVIYITNKKCLNESNCDGKLLSPYDSLITAFLKEGKLANSKISSKLTFIILGTPHFFVRKHLPKGMEQIFRRLNASIIIKPLYCNEENLAGCFSYSERPTIYVKVDLFYIYVSNTLKIYNISFDGRDLHLHTTASANEKLAAYNNDQTTLCNYSNINMLIFL